MADRSIQYVPLDQLKGDPRNPKTHSLDTIDESYTRFGSVDAITVDGRTGYIISGHGRTTALKAAYARGAEVPEGLKVDPETGEWLVPINSGWSSKDDVEAAAVLISMNRLTEMGGWADDSLLDLLKTLADSPDGFAGVGFGSSDMEDLQAYLDSEDAALGFDPDAVVDTDATATSVGPDLIQLTGDQVVVNVVVNAGDRDKLYALLESQAWVIDMRNSRGQ